MRCGWISPNNAQLSYVRDTPKLIKILASRRTTGAPVLTHRAKYDVPADVRKLLLQGEGKPGGRSLDDWMELSVREPLGFHPLAIQAMHTLFHLRDVALQDAVALTVHPDQRYAGAPTTTTPTTLSVLTHLRSSPQGSRFFELDPQSLIRSPAHVPAMGCTSAADARP
jgi:hypothetical protein